MSLLNSPLQIKTIFKWRSNTSVHADNGFWNAFCSFWLKWSLRLMTSKNKLHCNMKGDTFFLVLHCYFFSSLLFVSHSPKLKKENFCHGFNVFSCSDFPLREADCQTTLLPSNFDTMELNFIELAFIRFFSQHTEVLTNAWTTVKIQG